MRLRTNLLIVAHLVGNTFQRFMITFNISVIIGLLFLRLDYYQSDIKNREGVLFLLITQAVFMTGNSVLYLCKHARLC